MPKSKYDDKKNAYSEIRAHLPKKEITMLVGARQVGKTTIMKALQEELREKGEPTLFLNLDIAEDKHFFSYQLKLLSKIELEIGKNRGYILFT